MPLQNVNQPQFDKGSSPARNGTTSTSGACGTTVLPSTDSLHDPLHDLLRASVDEELKAGSDFPFLVAHLGEFKYARYEQSSCPKPCLADAM